MSENWLSDVIVINETNNSEDVGDLSIFRSLGDACRKVEPWYADEVNFYALNGLGQSLEFTSSGYTTKASTLTEVEPNPHLLLFWLSQSAKDVFEARQYKASKNELVLGLAESSHILPSTIEGLIAYIGFTN